MSQSGQQQDDDDLSKVTSETDELSAEQLEKLSGGWSEGSSGEKFDIRDR